MIKTILGTVLIIFAIVFIYPKELIFETIIGELIFIGDSKYDKNTIKIGNVEINSYERKKFLEKTAMIVSTKLIILIMNKLKK
jgi:hypothetical protein